MLAIVDRIEEFQSLREEWESAWRADPNATVFVAWPYVELMVNKFLPDWFVLTFQPKQASPRVGFLLVERRVGPDSQTLLIGRGRADETAFLCRPEHETQMLDELATAFTTRLSAPLIRLTNILDPRLDLFLARISDSGRYLVEETKRTPCPFVRLSGTWDDYLSKVLGPKSRKSLRYAMRRLRTLQQFRITDSHTAGDSFDHQLESLLNLYQDRWGVRSADELEIRRQTYRAFFTQSMLLLVVCYDGHVPVAGSASFIDRPRRTVVHHTGAYNSAYAQFSPGKALDGEIIQWAIENDFHIVDFGAGGEEYKYLFGAVDRFTRTVRIRRHTMMTRLKGWMVRLEAPRRGGQ